MQSLTAQIPTAGPTVLLIDDQPSVRLPLRISLLRVGYQVVEAGSGMEGLEVMHRRGEAIALVLVDHQMPRLSGADVIRELRRLPRHIPVILMSGLSSADAEVGTSEPDAFLRKPFELADLTQTIQQLIGPGTPAAALQAD